MAFIGFYEDSLADGKAKLTEMRRIGREDFSREFQIWTSCRVVCRPTEKEAREYAHSYIYEKGDFGAGETIIGEQGRKDPNLPPEVYERMIATRFFFRRYRAASRSRRRRAMSAASRRWQRQAGREIDVYTVGVVTCRPTAGEAQDCTGMLSSTMPTGRQSTTY